MHTGNLIRKLNAEKREWLRAGAYGDRAKPPREPNEPAWVVRGIQTCIDIIRKEADRDREIREKKLDRTILPYTSHQWIRSALMYVERRDWQRSLLLLKRAIKEIEGKK